MDLAALEGRVAREGAPLVDLPDEEGKCLVTFVWRGDAQTASVGVQSQLGRPFQLIGLQRLDSSDLWVGSTRVDGDVTASYQLVVDYEDPGRDLSALSREERGRVLLERFAHLRADPLNPIRYPPPWYSPELPEEQWESLLVMPKALPRPASSGRDTRGQLERHSLASIAFGADRLVEVYVPPTDPPSDGYRVVAVLDGTIWRSITASDRILEDLVVAGVIPPTVVLYVDIPLADRVKDLCCNPALPRFLAEELLPWAQNRWVLSRRPADHVVAGFSLGGLAAAWTGYSRPDEFGSVMSLSGSYWWGIDADEEAEWLSRQFAQVQRLPLRWYQAVGRLELFHPLDEAPGTSMGAANRHLRTILNSKGYSLTYEEFPGGHEFCSWELLFPHALEVLLAA